MVFSTKDVAVIAGLGILVFLITRAGRDLAGALGNIGNPLEGISLPSIGDINVGNPLETITDALPNLPEIFTGQTSAESIRVADDNPFFTDPIEPPIQIPQPEGSSVRITQGQPPVFVGGSEVLGPEGNQVPDALLGLNNFVNSFNRQPEAQFEQQIPSEQPFVGGGIFDTPISRLSLSQIVDKLNVSASQAADLQARAQDNFGDFNFGTNTGSGIGGVFAQPNINTELPGGNVSNQDFAGLSPIEIAQRLTGGNISNF